MRTLMSSRRYLPGLPPTSTTRPYGRRACTPKRTSGAHADLSPGSHGSHPATPAPAPRKRDGTSLGRTRQELLQARFGDAAQQARLDRAYHLAEAVNTAVVGQGDLARALQDRVVQLVEEAGKQRKVPLALHMIGLPGVGKSAALDMVKQVGVEVTHIDAHLFSGCKSTHEVLNMFARILPYRGLSAGPHIFIFDELDKIPELQDVDGRETSHPFLGILNQILTDGKVPGQGGDADFSNCLILTAMNFSPRQLDRFAPEVLGGDKSFYDFTVEDLQALDAWIRDVPGARAKVLAHMFRANTVSRLVPNTVIVKPLGHAEYRAIIARNVQQACQAAQRGAAAAKGLEVRFTPAYLDYLAARVVFPPSGARQTVAKAQLMTEQLVSYALKAPGTHPASLVQPRQARIDVGPDGRVQLQVSASRYVQQRWQPSDAFTLSIDYDANTQTFVQPPNLAVEPPMARTAERQLPPRAPTRREIMAARFVPSQSAAAGLAGKIDATLKGQERTTRLLQADLDAYLGRPGPVKKNPPFRVVAGFPGIGKSSMAELAAEHAGLPLARINLQAYAGTDAATLSNFISDLESAVSAARAHSGKYVLLLEELDKIFEVNPQTGNFVDRPVMNYIKDLLNDGCVKTARENNGSSCVHRIDVRDAYSLVTMNFGVERHGFSADPRLTGIDDMQRAWEQLQRPADLKTMLQSLFLPETVSRLMPRFLVMQPLLEPAYRAIIDQVAQQVVRERFYDVHGKNVGCVELSLTPAYRDYLYREAVIPSEGARNTVLVAEQRLGADLEAAMKALPPGSELASVPLRLWLDFRADSAEVAASAAPLAEPSAVRPLHRQRVALTFPPLRAAGPLSEERLLTAVHELGHLITGVRLGKRFSHVTVVPSQTGTGGYVRFVQSSQSARELVANLYTALGSRAMERIFLSADPQARESVLQITAGASSDIKQATATLYQVLYTFGFDPEAGPIERSGKGYARFSELSEEALLRMQRILQRMEDYVVEDLLRAHPKAWYVQRAAQLAQAGGLDEAEAYAMLDHPQPGADRRVSLAPNPRLRDAFAGVLPYPADAQAAHDHRDGSTGTTAGENLDRAVSYFAQVLRDLR